MSTPLDQAAILRDLEAAGVRYVVTGSVAAAAYGVPVEPRDFDIAPGSAYAESTRGQDGLHQLRRRA